MKTNKRLAMNNDLISRSALLEEYCRQNECLQNHSGDCRNCFGSDVIKTAPAVDAVDADKALEWLEGYTFTDTKQVYTNGTVLVPLFRVRQALKDKAYNGLMEG